MTPTRRTFVAGIITGVPALAFAQRAPRPPQGQAVWRQIDAELARIHAELQGNPRPGAAIRSFESTLRFLASYTSENGIDSIVASQLGKAVAERGRSEFIRSLDEPDFVAWGEKAVRRRFPSLTDEHYRRAPSVNDSTRERALNDMLANGYSPMLLAGAEEMRALSALIGAMGPSPNFVKASFMACEEPRAFYEFAAAEAGFLLAASFWIPELAPVAAEAGIIAVIAWAAVEICEIFAI